MDSSRKREAWTAKAPSGDRGRVSRDNRGDTRVRGDYDRRSRDHDRARNVRGNPSVPGIMILGVTEDRSLGRGVVLQVIMVATAAGSMMLPIAQVTRSMKDKAEGKLNCLV